MVVAKEEQKNFDHITPWHK